MVIDVGSRRAQQEEEEPHRDGHLQDRLQQDCLLQPHKCHGRLVQESHAACRQCSGLTEPTEPAALYVDAMPTPVTLTYEHHSGLCSLWDLLHQPHFVFGPGVTENCSFSLDRARDKV